MPKTTLLPKLPLKSLENPGVFQYVKTYYDIYVFDNKAKKSTLVRCWGHCGMIGVLLGSGLAASASAEVRRYDPSQAQSGISVPRGTTPMQPEKEAQMPSREAVQAPVATVAVSDSAYVAALQALVPKPPKLGTAQIFLKADNLSPETVDRLRELKALDGLQSEIYLHDIKVEDLVGLFSEKLKSYPEGLEFNLDFGGALASQLQVKGKNTLVYTDPKGKTAQFEINSGYGFRTAVEKIKQGSAQ